MNSNYNGNQIYTGTHLLKGFFSRTSVLTVTVASAILTALIIFQTIISGYSGKKINMLAALYYLFGNNSASIVNVVFGSIVSLITILFFASFLSIYLKAKSIDEDSPASGLSLLLFSSITYVIVASITIILSFASISVLRYQSQELITKYDSREFGSNYRYSEAYTSSNASNDFICYIAFGTFAILLGIGAVRLILAMRKACMGEVLANRGGSLFLIGSIGMVSLTCISFIVALFDLVSNDSALDPIILLFSIINVLIFGAASAVLFGLIFLESHYSMLVNRTYKTPHATSYYASYATNVYPTNAVRPIPPTMPSSRTNPNSYSTYNSQGVPPYSPTNPMPQANSYQKPVNNQPQQPVSTPIASTVSPVTETVPKDTNETNTATSEYTSSVQTTKE